MTRHTTVPAVALALLAGALADPSAAGSIAYPETRRVDQVDLHHGVAVADPYRWLEEMDSDETLAWARAQDELARRFTAGPLRESLAGRLRDAQRFPSYGVPFRRGERLFFTERQADQKAAVLYVQEPDAEPRVLIDPNPLSADGSLTLRTISVNRDGTQVAYAIGGTTGWSELRIRSVDTGADLPETLPGVRGPSIGWDRDGRGFHYDRYDAPEPGAELQTTPSNHRVVHHRLGTPATADRIVYARPDRPEWFFSGVRTSDDGRYLVFHPVAGADPHNALYYLDLDVPGATPVELVPEGLAAVTFEGNDGAVFWVQTDLDAPRRRLVAIDLDRPGPEHWRDVVPQQSGTLTGVSAIGGRWLMTYAEEVRRTVRVFAPDGTAGGTIQLPDISGNISGLVDRPEDPITYFRFSGIVDPGTIYRYDVHSGELAVHRRPDTLTWDPAEFVTEQVFVTSRDGTRVPMFVTHRRGLERDGSHPTLMYGYGAYQWTAFPWFQAMRVVWLRSGGVFALPGIRGGGEYGAPWHEAGRLTRKQNTFDDFIAAAQWLVEQRYTRPDRLALQGGSASGMLPGVLANQRPDLFAASLVNYPTVDLIRGPLHTGGAARVPEFGSADDPEQLRTLLAYSPIHNTRTGSHYPAMLVAAGGRDDIAVPMHAYKLAAALQHAQGGDAPILMRVGWEDGHYPSGVDANVELWADQLAFLMRALRMTAATPAAGAP